MVIDNDMRSRYGSTNLTGQVGASCHATGNKYTGCLYPAAVSQTDCRYPVRAFYGFYGLGTYSQLLRYISRLIAAIGTKRDRRSNRQQHLRFMQSILATTKDDDRLFPVEKGITDSTIADPLPFQLNVIKLRK